jgi:hypothetical protein
VDEHAEGILAQPFRVVWGEDDGQDGGPSLGRGKACVLIAALDPGDPEAVVGGSDHVRDFDRDLDFADLGKRIVGSRIVVERDGTLVGDEVVGESQFWRTMTGLLFGVQN